MTLRALLRRLDEYDTPQTGKSAAGLAMLKERLRRYCPSGAGRGCREGALAATTGQPFS